MTAWEIIYAVLLLALVLAYIYTLRSIASLEVRVRHQRELISQHWREHKDEHYEGIRKHDRLVKSLGFKEVPGTPASYKKEST